jgi:acetyl-CoA carboxylase carboxyl transferase subunit alpha
VFVFIISDLIDLKGGTMQHYLEFEKPVVELEEKIRDLKRFQVKGEKSEEKKFSSEISNLEEKAKELRQEIYDDLDEWTRVQLSRHPGRPYTLDYIERIFTNFVELAGDRNFGDDKAIIGGFANLNGKTVMVIGHQKGRTVEERTRRNFSMPNPEGYRKALRLMKLAERLGKPIITFLDTLGAYPGLEAEERGQSEAIATNIMEMSRLKVPVVSVVIGEGGSGGALGIGVCNRLLMMEYSVYSVISPEGCASILLRDGTKGPEMSKQLKITAPMHKKFGIADEIVKEPEGGAHRDFDLAAARLKESFLKHLDVLSQLSADELKQDRHLKVRAIGAFSEPESTELIN